MSKKRLGFAMATVCVLAACSDNNSVYLDDNSELAFDEFLLQLVDPTRASDEPISITDKRFRFPLEQAAFAGLFPSGQ